MSEKICFCGSDEICSCGDDNICENCGKELRYNSYYDFTFHIENGMQTYGCFKPAPAEKEVKG